MTKTQKTEYILSVFNKFENAENHGTSGTNWWNPKPCTIAYNVKLHNWGDVDDMRKVLSEKQNAYLSDEDICDAFDRERGAKCDALVADIRNLFGLSAHFAGRSGGWLEVDFSEYAEDIDDIDGMEEEEINDLYEKARKLDDLEGEVEKTVRDSVQEYEKYVGTEEYYNDIARMFVVSDDDIDEICDKKIKEAENIKSITK